MEGIPPVRIENGERLTRDLIKNKTSITLKRNALKEARQFEAIYKKSSNYSGTRSVKIYSDYQLFRYGLSSSESG